MAMFGGGGGRSAAFFSVQAADLQRRAAAASKRAPQEYRGLDTTKILGEAEFYSRPTGDKQQQQQRVCEGANHFWADVALHFAQAAAAAEAEAAAETGTAPAQPRLAFVSPHSLQATSSATEVMFAVALTELPIEAAAAEDGYQLVAQPEGLLLSSSRPLLVCHRSLERATVGGVEGGVEGEEEDDGEDDDDEEEEQGRVLSALKYFADPDGTAACRQKQPPYLRRSPLAQEAEGTASTTEASAAAATGRGKKALQLETGRVYGAHVLLSNLGDRPRSLSVLTQIPEGAVAVASRAEGREKGAATPLDATRVDEVVIPARGATRLTRHFYFPLPGCYGPAVAYTAEAGQEGRLLSCAVGAGAGPLVVLTQLPPPDASDLSAVAWSEIAGRGSNEDVCRYLSAAAAGDPGAPSVSELLPKLHLIAWRLQDWPLYTHLVQLLEAAATFHPLVWSFALYHGDVRRARQALSAPPLLPALLKRCCGAGQDTAEAVFAVVSPARAAVRARGSKRKRGEAGLDVYPGWAAAAPGGKAWWMSGGGAGGGVLPAHLEFAPLVNARAHQLGDNGKTLNPAVEAEWRQLLQALANAPTAAAAVASAAAAAVVPPGSPEEELKQQQQQLGGLRALLLLHVAAVYYLLLQDRVEEAQCFFGRVEALQGAVRRLTGGKEEDEGGAGQVSVQIAYMRCYLLLLTAEPADAVRAREVALRYASYPIARWRELFAAVLQATSEFAPPAAAAAAVGGGEAEEGGDESVLWDGQGGAQQQQALMDPALRLETVEVKGEGGGVELQLRVSARNVRERSGGLLLLHAYSMDLEMLYSFSPELTKAAKSFNRFRPNFTRRITLPAAATSTSDGADGISASPAGVDDSVDVCIALPREVQDRPAWLTVEAPGCGVQASKLVLAHRLNVDVSERFGQLMVRERTAPPNDTTTSSGPGKPLSRVYLKVYATGRSDKQATFYKDGYTDIRGRFDYATLSTDQLKSVTSFSILVVSREHGSLVVEARPPRAAASTTSTIR